MQCKVVTSGDEFYGLRDNWSRLHALAKGSVFQTHDWLWTWWQVYGHRFQLRVLTAWDDGHLAGVFPCFIQRLWSSNILRFLGEYAIYGEYVPLIAPGYEDRMARESLAFCTDELALGRCDIIDFHHFTDASSFMRAFREGLRQMHLGSTHVVHSLPRVAFQTPHDWDGYLKSLPRHERRRLGMYERALNQHGARVEVVTDSRSPDIDELPRLHALLWKSRGSGGFFEERMGFSEFYRTGVTRLMESGIAREYVLRKDGTVFGALVAFFLHDRCCVYVGGRDPHHELSKYSPGKTLVARAIRDAIKEGYRLCDLQEGTTEYKFRMGGRLGWYSRLTVFPRGMRGMKGRAFALWVNVHDRQRRFLQRKSIAQHR